MTNREWLMNEIQNMSDAELAEVMSIENLCEEQYSKNKCAGRICRECKEEWLKQERIEKITLSEAEKVILENLDKRYKWIARDNGGSLCVYESKPFKTDMYIWNNMTNVYKSLSVFKHLFQFVKWEDKEPHNIKELLEASEDED